MSTSRLELIALPGLPIVRPGDDLADLIDTGLAAAGVALKTRDVLVLAQKIVSKAALKFNLTSTLSISARLNSSAWKKSLSCS